MDSLHVPGMAIAVVKPDRIVLLDGLGYRNVESELPVTGETDFYIASMTKPFVALSILLLEADSLIDLNRPVRTYLPRFRLRDHTESITITIRDLLAHRRGLQDYAITFGEAFSGQMTEERFYRLLRNVWAVGELDYQNLHYTILGRVIEAVSGKTWQEFLAERVLAPAGLAHTTTTAAPLTTNRSATPYEWVDDRYRAVRPKSDRTMHAAGGMVSTAEDLARWVQIHLNSGSLDGRSLFPADVVGSMASPQIYEDDSSPVIPQQGRVGWGLAWDLRHDRGSRVAHHGGAYAGWAGLMSFMPETRTGVVVLTNSRAGGRWLAQMVAADIYDRVRGLDLRSTLPRVLSFLRPTVPPAGPTLSLDGYRGTYFNEDWGTLEAWVDETGELTARIGDLLLPLEWTGPDEFVADGDQPGEFHIEDSEVVGVSLGGLAAEGQVRFERN